MEQTIRYVSIASAFKVGMVLGALVFAIVGIFAVLLPGLLGAAFITSLGGRAQGVAAFLGVAGYVIGIVVVGIFSGIGYAINAILYNIVAGLVGGIRVTLE